MSENDAYWEAENAELLRSVNEALAHPAGVNSPNQYGDTPLVKAIRLSNREQRLLLVKALIQAGAEPNFRDSEGNGDALFAAVLEQDAEVLEVLLANGADPNYLVDGPESLYDWAEFDYRYEAWELNEPIEPSDRDSESEDHWLAYLVRCSEFLGFEAPKHLQVLRRYGALTAREIDRESMRQIHG